MGLPKLGHLQFVVLGIIWDESILGREVREGLKKTIEVITCGPKFYQLMNRMEDVWLIGQDYLEKIEE